MAEITVNGLRFELFKRTNTARVKNIAQGFKNQSTFDIPETVTSEGIIFRVSEIGEEAFKDCASLILVTIPNSVTSIGEKAFSTCKSLPSITIPNSVTSIGLQAFESCNALKSITIPNSVTYFSGECFNSCSSLTSIVVSKNNKVYDSRENCHAIIKTETNLLLEGCQNTIIPNSVTRIGAGAFKGCSGLTSITIPNSVTRIGAGAFEGCDKLSSVTIENKNGKVAIGRDAFPSSAKINYVGKPKGQNNLLKNIQKLLKKK